MAPPTQASILRNMRRLHRSYVRLCKRKNVYWELSVDVFHKLTSSPCHYCKRPPAQVSRTYLYNGIDRKNPKQGYIAENCVPCCKECNWIKGDRLSHEEMLVVAQALATFRSKKR